MTRESVTGIPYSFFSAAVSAAPPRRPCATPVPGIARQPNTNKIEHAYRDLDMLESDPCRELEATRPSVFLRLQTGNFTECGTARDIKTRRSATRMIQNVIAARSKFQG